VALDPEQLKESIKLLDEFEKRTKELREGNTQAQKEIQKDLYTAMEDYFEMSTTELQKRIDSLYSTLKRAEGEQAELLETRIELLETLRDLEGETQEEFIEDIRERTSVLGDLKNVLTQIKDKVSDMFSDFDTEAAKQFGETAALVGMFGIGIPKVKEMFRDYAVGLDDARRSIIPFATSVERANELQNQLASVASETKIPLSDLGNSVSQVSSDFGLFSVQSLEAQAAIVGFQAQMKAMGVEGGSAIIESLISEGGFEDAEKAIDMFKGLTGQMMQLGLTPIKLKEDYDKLIGTFGMFGNQAALNIAKVSFMAEKAKVDTGAITGFADNFKGYSQAAQTAQTINATFGAPIITDPAELVRTFYTAGPAGALQLVKAKIAESGLDLEQLLAGGAGAARLQMLSQLGFGSAQAARRLLTTDQTQAELDQINQGVMPGTPEAEAARKAFDRAQIEALNQDEVIKAATEQATIVAMEKGLGVMLGDFGKLFNRLTESIEKFTTGPLTDAAIKMGQAQIPGVGKSAQELTQNVMNPNAATVTPKEGEAFFDNIEAAVIKGSTEAFGGLKEGLKELGESLDGLQEQLKDVLPGSAPGDSSSARNIPDTIVVKIGRQSFQGAVVNAFSSAARGGNIG
tara:strand:+ start:237 stop:2129 length:1893 start_codon:yes stop_codon:yes gene_type:complete